ncbi:hypothetical protein F1C76_02525 [Geodermatophilaceae bacterium NBWT11]|jgi:hypothetical protein|nr:hypothetical protein F1C76_02525 [Geodermatophilaceae bacterium NBWT11]
MSKRVLTGAGVWVLAVLGGYLLDPILGTAVLVFGGILLVVSFLGSTGRSTTFEERELARARKRAAAREANAGKRAKDKLRYEAEQARKAKRAAKRSAKTG